jgi:hypothetical protein
MDERKRIFSGGDRAHNDYEERCVEMMRRAEKRDGP